MWAGSTSSSSENSRKPVARCRVWYTSFVARSPAPSARSPRISAAFPDASSPAPASTSAEANASVSAPKRSETTTFTVNVPAVGGRRREMAFSFWTVGLSSWKWAAAVVRTKKRYAKGRSSSSKHAARRTRSVSESPLSGDTVNNPGCGGLLTVKLADATAALATTPSGTSQ
eukprot:scaffold1224_cov191-Pinguiococcus_pyrenoidosus.AAC.14